MSYDGEIETARGDVDVLHVHEDVHQEQDQPVVEEHARPDVEHARHESQDLAFFVDWLKYVKEEKCTKGKSALRLLLRPRAPDQDNDEVPDARGLPLGHTTSNQNK